MEELMAKILEKSGYTIPAKGSDFQNQRPVDLIANNSENLYYIEIKASTSALFTNHSILDAAISKIMEVSGADNAIPVLVVFSAIPESIKDKYRSVYNNLIILDISNLLYAVQSTELQDELIALLPFSVDGIVPKEGAINLGWLKHSDDSVSLIKQLDDCLEGNSDAAKFEDICFNFLKYIFSEDLSLWQTQPKSNNDLYRFDLLCRIKDNTSKTFWTMMENYFHSKYIVFEFKNYSDKITQKEIYTTERYLYAKALRNVAIIISRNGFDNNSIWAAKGSLRENGKLILLITVDDLKTMCELKYDQQDSSEFLLNKLDSMLTDLEK